jgi:hypothetical protein
VKERKEAKQVMLKIGEVSGGQESLRKFWKIGGRYNYTNSQKRTGKPQPRLVKVKDPSTGVLVSNLE